MATFSIGFVGEIDSEDYDGNPHLLGRLQFGDGEYDYTSFHSPLEVWTREDYEAHWRDGLARALTGQPAALVTAMYEGTIFMIFELVPVDQDEVLVYERYPGLDTSVNPPPEDLHSLVTGRSDAIHERIAMADIAAFVSTRRP